MYKVKEIIKQLILILFESTHYDMADNYFLSNNFEVADIAGATISVQR